jgi:hypothetical protein
MGLFHVEGGQAQKSLIMGLSIGFSLERKWRQADPEHPVVMPTMFMHTPFPHDPTNLPMAALLSVFRHELDRLAYCYRQ